MFTAKDTGSGNNWEVVPKGVHHGVCYALIDLGTQYSEIYNVSQHKCWIAWELPHERIDIETEEGDKENKARVISKFYTVSLHEKSNLRQHLESWRGRVFTKDELKGFDLSSILNVNCQINVIHKKKKNGDNKAEIGAIMPLGKSQQKIKAENNLVYFSLEEHGLEIPENVPDGIKAMITKSSEYNQQGQMNDWPEPNYPDEPPIHNDDDIPF